jgi:tRNA modification GTPase
MGAASSTLVGCCTARGIGALALIRITGPEAFSIVQRIARSPSSENISTRVSHTIVYGSVLAADGSTIDTALFLIMHGPRTFTGDDTVEITCHNNDLIIEKIVDRALECGARSAGPGAFTRRAVENGKLDLIQAEAIHELIAAQNEWVLKKSHEQLTGTLSHALGTIEKKLISVLAWSEASFDFLDEGGGFAPQIRDELVAISDHIARIQTNEARMDRLRAGMRVALIGIVNAGKSSLFNALIGTKRAIVSPHAGTTRDTIEAQIVESGTRWTLIDTAGLRSTHDSIEQEGIERSYEEAARADIIILARPADRKLSVEEELLYEKLAAEYAQKSISVITKSDLGLCSEDGLPVSVQTGSGIQLLKRTIIERGALLTQSGDAPYLLTRRQILLLRASDQEIKKALSYSGESPHYELISHHISAALCELSGMTGKTISEAAMDTVFKEFCVGK